MVTICKGYLVRDSCNVSETCADQFTRFNRSHNY